MPYIRSLDMAWDWDEPIVKSSAYRYSTVEPARRHKCEMCREIFECHICDLDGDHPLHMAFLLCNEPVLVCLECMEKDGLGYVFARGNGRDYVKKLGSTCRMYDYRTGKIMWVRRIVISVVSPDYKRWHSKPEFR